MRSVGREQPTWGCKFEHNTAAPEPFELADGRHVTIRRIQPDDAPRLQRSIARMSPETRRLRFFTPLKALTDDFAEHLANVDFVDRAAYVVCLEDEDDVRAVGRYELDGPGTAEVAFAVEDEFQHLGIATELLQHLAAHARQNEIAVFTAIVLAENQDMLEVFRHGGFEFSASSNGSVVNVSMQLAPVDAEPTNSSISI